MATNLFNQYGIKEVADVIFYDLTSGTPVMYFDTLKVSTIETTAEQADARGGKGNPKLITWDYGKEITVTLQDALLSMKSLNLMTGGTGIAHTATKKIKKAELVALDANKEFDLSYTATANVYILDAGANAVTGTTKDWAYTAGSAGDVVRVMYEVTSTLGGVYEVVINPGTFPGTYMVIGDTIIRNKVTGVDEGFQFIIPKAKLSSEVSISMEAEGDPSVFDMTLTVLKADNGTMMSLVRYDIGDAVAASTMSNLT
jgi:hypothetical protein